MPSGLINIVSYGSQDLFLNGTPEITFFKLVYRRHTPFSIESIPINFDDPVGFGKKSAITIQKVGDLIHKAYLQITLPEVSLKRFLPSTPPFNNTAVTIATNNYNIITSFMSINRNAFVAAYEVYLAQNTSGTSVMVSQINSVFNVPNNAQPIFNIQKLLLDSFDAPYTYNEISMQIIAQNYNGNDKNELFNLLQVGIDKSIKIQNFYFNQLKTAQKLFLDSTNPNIKFAWVSRIGHAIIKEIEVFIGGQKIDKHYGDWLNIWYELSANRDLEATYFNLIGNINILTDFNRIPKPSYTLNIPLQFWFCKYSGLALPLVALEYHDVRMEVTFRRLEEVSYVEDGTIIKWGSEGLYLDEVNSEIGLDISANLLIDYIYLDTGERNRFAQSSHEYLIEQLQLIEYEDITETQLQAVLNSFVHPSKELIWVAQQQQYTENTSGYNNNQWFNYGINGLPIVEFSSIFFNSYIRVPKLSANYFNYLQPYQHHSTTPAKGINVYSFSLFPEEHQPSGAANLSIITRVTVIMDFNPLVFKTGNGKINVRLYTRNFNILKIASGMGSVAFTYG